MLGACDATEKVTGPDPDEAAQGLATAFGTGDFADVEPMGLGLVVSLAAPGFAP